MFADDSDMAFRNHVNTTEMLMKCTLFFNKLNKTPEIKKSVIFSCFHLQNSIDVIDYQNSA